MKIQRFQAIHSDLNASKIGRIAKRYNYKKQTNNLKLLIFRRILYKYLFLMTLEEFFLNIVHHSV